MQLHADDGRARDPGGSPFACESGCARPRERRAVGARPKRYGVLARSRVSTRPAPTAPRVGMQPRCDRARKGDEAGAEATRGVDEALQAINELELRRRFRVDPAEGPAIDLQGEGFNLNGGLTFLVARPEPPQASTQKALSRSVDKRGTRRLVFP